MTWQDPGGNNVPGGSPVNGDASSRAEGGAPPPPGPGAPPPAPGLIPPPAPATQPGYPSPGMAWAPPEAAYASPSGLRFADVLPRFVAWLLDIALMTIVTSIITVVLNVALLGSIDWRSYFQAALIGAPIDESIVGQLALVTLVSTVVTTVIDLTYFVFQWSSGARATLGMRLLRLQVGNAADGRTLGLAQASRRWFAMGSWLSLLSAIPIVGNIVALLLIGWDLVLLITTGSSPTRQGLHDRFADTAVVSRSEGDDRVLAGCLAIIGIAVLFAIVAIVALIFLGAQVSGILEDVGNSI